MAEKLKKGGLKAIAQKGIGAHLPDAVTVTDVASFLISVFILHFA